MTETGGWRRALAALLMIVTALAGAGRVAAAADAFRALGALGAPICHSGPRSDAERDPAVPGVPPSPDCCDDCALMALAVLPTPPTVAGPVPVASLVGLAPAGRPAPALPRPRGPCRARGPPLG